MENGNINPWLHLWTRPRTTMRFIINRNPRKIILWLAIIGGIISTFAFVDLHALIRTKFVALLFIVLAVLGAVMGIIHLYFSGWLLKLTGSWLGGKGSFIDLKCAVGWSNYPFIVANIIAILSAISTPVLWLLTILSLLTLILIIWAFVIFMKLIGEAHQFSAWKALLAFLIAIVLVFVALMIIALLVPLLSPLFQ
jgi:hypothetical protein